MVAAITSIHESEDRGQALLNEVVQLFVDLLLAGGATMETIRAAAANSVERNIEGKSFPAFTELGSLQRDCMEVMCTWRRDLDFVDENGDPRPLTLDSGHPSFSSLCRKSECRHGPEKILKALLAFGAVSKDSAELLHSETPTFLLGASAAGGRVATDSLIKHLAGYLGCVHRNVCSFSGRGKAKFERACTVTVATELEPVFDRLVRSRGQEFIDSIDEWLERNTKYESPSDTYIELGAGAYFLDFGIRQGRKRVSRTGVDYC
jgi:hypothetical protein